MSRIDGQGGSTVSGFHHPNGDLSAESTFSDNKTVGKSDSDVYTRLSNLQLRPWLLQLDPIRDPQRALLDGLLSEVIEPILAESEGQVTASVAEILIRIEPTVTATGDEVLTQDLDALGDYLRMVEHLRALQVVGAEP